MKKSLLVASLLAAFALSACNNSHEQTQPQQDAAAAPEATQAQQNVTAADAQQHAAATEATEAAPAAHAPADH